MARDASWSIRCAGSRTAASSSPPTPNCREHHYTSPAMRTRRPPARARMRGDGRFGRLLGVSVFGLSRSGAGRQHPARPVQARPHYRCRTWSVATNKPPILPYRGVARTGVCYAIETIMDAIAVEAGIEPFEVRLRNLVRAEEMPFDNITGKHFDSGDYPEAVRRAIAAIDIDAVRARQRAASRTAVASDFGISVFCEQGAHGTSVYHGWGIPDGARARAAPCCASRPTAFWKCASACIRTARAWKPRSRRSRIEVLGIDTERVRVLLGDTGMTPYSTGTWGSRSIVMAGGAVGQAMQGTEGAPAEDRLLAAGERRRRRALGERLRRRRRAVARTIAEIARVWYLKPQLLPPGVDPRGFEVSVTYQAKRDTGTFSYACHAVVVAVDIEVRQGRDPRLRHRRGRRRADQSDDRRRAGVRRRGAGHRHRAL